jgi:hypothetical protein
VLREGRTVPGSLANQFVHYASITFNTNGTADVFGMDDFVGVVGPTGPAPVPEPAMLALLKQ